MSVLTVMWIVPAVGAVVAALLPARAGHSRARANSAAKYIGLTASIAVLVMTIVVAARFDTDGARYQFVESHYWIKDFGARYAVGVDGIAVVLLLLTAALVPVLLVAGWRDADRADQTASNVGGPIGAVSGPGRYVALILAVEAMVIVSFVSLDVLLFYIVFEAMLIPMYFLLGGFGGTASDPALRSRAAVKFLLYNLFGGLVMMAAVIGLWVVTDHHGGGTFDLRTITEAISSGSLHIDPGVEKALFGGFMFAFAVKAPLWPLHSWLPDAAVQSTPAAAVLMMAVVDKVGTFAMLRYCVQLFPDATRYFTPLIIILAVISIIYGAIVAIGQRDVMRLIAYTSISHFGFIVLGIFAFTSQGQSGSTLYMVNHGISTAALMLVAGYLVAQRGSRNIADFGGTAKVAPILAGVFLIAGLATLSLPGLSPFISEFLVLIGTFTRYPVAAIIASTAIVLAAIYILWTYQRMMTGPARPDATKLHDLGRRELAVLTPLLALLLVFGIYPKPLLALIDPAVGHTLTTVHQTDPPPTAEPKGGDAK